MGKPGNSKRIGGATNNISISASSTTASQPQQPNPQPQMQPQQPQQQPPQPAQPKTPQITTVDLNKLQQFAALDDRAMARAILDAQSAQLPIFLLDRPSATQNLVFAQDFNEMPLVLSNYDFNNYLLQHGIPKSQVMFRSSDGGSFFVNGQNVQFTLTPGETLDMLRYNPYSYVGGKHGGMVYGAGSYFSMASTGSTGYGSVTTKAVLSPSASIISKSQLTNRQTAFDSKMPLTAREIRNAVNRPGVKTGETYSLYALAQGFNVITDSTSNPDYHNVILRSAMVMNKNNF